ncbi:MAG: hypothetical protein DHS20C08_04680 [Rhodomicrobium sp.]|nr:MAG: hypothetical protein DHS20C08_04680 [Rhodomicrobium sp.]
MQGLGKSIAGFAGAFNAFAGVQEKNDKIDTNMKLLEFQMDQDQKQFEAQTAIDGDGRNHVDTSLNRYDFDAGGLLNNIPESQRDRASLQLKRSRFSIQNEAQRQQMGYQNEYWKGRGVEYGNNVIQKVITPDSLKEGGLEAAKAATGIIDKSLQDMPVSPRIKGAMKKTLTKAAAERVVETIDPKQYFKMMQQKASVEKVAPKKTSSILPKNPVGKAIEMAANSEGLDPNIVGQIAKIESNFKPHAKNPLSSARGLGQFINSTARSYGLKNDGSDSIAAQARALASFTADNAKGLKAALGRNPTPGELYLAHFAGMGGARKIATAKGNAPISAVLGKDAVRANPFLRGKTVAQVQSWAAKKMGAGGNVKIASNSNDISDYLFSEKNVKRVQKRHEAAIEAETVSRMTGKSSVVLETAVDGLRDQLEANPGNADLAVAVKAAEGKLKQQHSALKNDPLKYADDQGVAEVPSLITAQDPVKGISRRIEDAEKVADTYQIEPTYFRQEERAFYAQKFNELDVNGKLEMLKAFEQGAGGKAGKLLKELNGVDQSMAHIGGLYLTGQRETAILAMQGLDVMKDKGLKNVTESLKNADVLSAYSAKFGNAFGPDTIKQSGPFIATAKAIATAKMLQGVTPSDALAEGMKLATGYSENNGEQYGGIGEFNDQSFLMHPDHKASDVLDVFEHLVTRDNYKENDNPNSDRNDRRGVEINEKPLDIFLKIDGVNPTNPDTHRPVTAEDMEDASFISVGPGRYIIQIDGLPLRDTKSAVNVGDGLTAYPDVYVFDLAKNMDRVKDIIQY